MPRHSHEFLIAFVLFNSPDQTEKIQTCWKGMVRKKRVNSWAYPSFWQPTDRYWWRGL